MKDASQKSGRTSAREELENYRRLVELQSQIVELSRRNREAERSCRRLRDQVEREGWGRISRGRSRRLLGPVERLLQARPLRWLSGWADRWRRRGRSATPPWAESTGPVTTLFSD